MATARRDVSCIGPKLNSVQDLCTFHFRSSNVFNLFIALFVSDEDNCNPMPWYVHVVGSY